jgi:hypothetical protein
MTSGHFRHLPVVGDAGLVGIVDIADVCRALLEPTFPGCPPAQSSSRGTFTGPFAASDVPGGPGTVARRQAVR